MGTTKDYVMFLLLLVGLIGKGTGQDLSRLAKHLQQFESVRHPVGGAAGAREAASRYIKDQFREYGLEVMSHAFNTSLQGTTMVGENVIGVVKGAKKGPVLVIGADYDTNLSNNPMEDNGAGVSVMLEAARNYMEVTSDEGEFNAVGTLIFVAFDLNTREYNSASGGEPGSYHFVHQWLWPFINQSTINFGGAIILDSITKFNLDDKTQYLPPGFSETFPDAYKRISDDGLKGNFLAVITRGTSQSIRLASSFVDNYNKHRKAGLIRTEEMILNTASQIDPQTVSMIDHQAHFHFWTFQPSEEPTALPALLLTDTDIHRRPSEVCPDPCTSSNFLTRRRRQALYLTSEGLIHTLLSLQGERKPPGENSGSAPQAIVTLTATWTMALITMLLR